MPREGRRNARQGSTHHLHPLVTRTLLLSLKVPPQQTSRREPPSAYIEKHHHHHLEKEIAIAIAIGNRSPTSAENFLPILPWATVLPLRLATTINYASRSLPGCIRSPRPSLCIDLRHLYPEFGTPHRRLLFALSKRKQIFGFVLSINFTGQVHPHSWPSGWIRCGIILASTPFRELVHIVFRLCHSFLTLPSNS